MNGCLKAIRVLVRELALPERHKEVILHAIEHGDKEPERRLSLGESARRLGISKRTLHRHIAAGDLHPIRKNRKAVFLLESEVESAVKG